MQVGADSTRKNRFGETCQTITESVNNGGQKLSIFMPGGKHQPVSELEKLEAAQRDKSVTCLPATTVPPDERKVRNHEFLHNHLQ